MKVRKCPICKSKDLDYMPWLGQKYRCRKCKYMGTLVIEEDIPPSKSSPKI
ncbi:MAG TPA: hypothetical protein VJ343_03540 [archaeon]|nr:hypothetical protein [archaeon]